MAFFAFQGKPIYNSKMNYFNLHTKARLFIFLFLFVHSIAAGEIVISKISFIGLKRTRTNTALQIISPISIGAVYTEETESRIIQKMRESGIFNPDIEVNVTIAEQMAEIEIIVKDRWTLIPIPIFSISKNETWKAGILGIEGNLLGYNKTLGLGYFFGSEGWSLLSFYSDDDFLKTFTGFSAGLSLGLNETIDENTGEEAIRSFQSDDIRLTLELDAPVYKKLSLLGGWKYDRSELRKNSSRETGIEDLNSTGLSIGAKWKEVYYDIPFEYGLLASTDYSWNWGLEESENYQFIRYKVKWGINTLWKHLLLLTAEGAYSKDLPVQSQFRLGGTPGSLILPMEKIGAEEFITSSTAYNIPLWSFPGGTLSSKAFYEFGNYKSDIAGRTSFHGPGVGLEVFIDDLAIPAIQFTIAWNRETGLYQFTAGVGMGGNPD